MDTETYVLNYIQQIPGFEDYFASRDGEIYSNKSGTIKPLELQEDVNGYLTCTLYKSGKKMTCKVYRLVAQTWLPNPDKLPVPDHIDENKKNNRVDNLEWVSWAESNRRAQASQNFNRYMIGIVQATLDGQFVASFESTAQAERETGIDGSGITKVLKKKRRKAGEFAWFYAKDFKEGVPQRGHALEKPVNQYDMDGNFIRSFASSTEAAKHVGALRPNISNACTGKSKSCRGFIWKEAEPEEIEEEKDETEDWVVLDDFPIYKISRDGRIYTTWLNRMKIQTSAEQDGILKGYLSINMVDKDGNKNNKGYIHRLVAMAYIPKPKGKDWVNHKDGNKRNNVVENLEWCTPPENAQHAHDTGLCSSNKITIQYDLDGNEIARYRSLRVASDETGITQDAISKVCRGEIKCNQTGGFGWAYAKKEEQ